MRVALLFIGSFLANSAWSIDRLILVNGGYEPSSNYATHVENLLSFKNTFSSTPSKIFNASGPKALVVPMDASGHYERDTAGYIRFKPYEIKGEVLPAMKGSLEAGFSNVQDAKDILVYWGDHGGRGHLCLWENTGLKPSDIRQLYAKVPKDARIRAIHAHCYGGSSMMDERREAPLKADGWSRFLSTYYPSNVCGLTGSGQDEVGSYVGWGKSAADSPWTAMLNETGASLESLKAGLVEKYMPFPKLTSDYLVEDLVRYFCGTREISSHEAPDEVARRERPQVEEPKCESVTRVSDYDKIDAQFAMERELTKERGWILSGIRAHYIQETYPKIHDKYTASKTSIERLKSELALATDTKEIKRLEEALRGARVADILAYDELDFNISHGNVDKEKYAAFFKKEGRKLIGRPEYRSTYPKLAEKRIISASFFDQDPSSIYVYEESDKAQKARQAAGLKLQERRRKFVEARLKSSEHEKLKEVYENIRKCETDPLR